jgi:hypothetical protein
LRVKCDDPIVLVVIEVLSADLLRKPDVNCLSASPSPCVLQTEPLLISVPHHRHTATTVTLVCERGLASSDPHFSNIEIHYVLDWRRYEPVVECDQDEPWHVLPSRNAASRVTRYHQRVVCRAARTATPFQIESQDSRARGYILACPVTSGPTACKGKA